MNRADFLPYRQIHLDFHTSEAIEGIGADFDPDEFADTLAKAHVNSITVFARCHHGWIYYQSQANPERIHPHLARPNLLKGADRRPATHAGSGRRSTPRSSGTISRRASTWIGC